VKGLAEPYNAPRQILPPVYWQTGHIDAIRVSTIRRKKSLTGDVIYPLVIDPRYAVDLDNLSDWAKYEALASSGLDMVTPGRRKRAMPETIELIIADFDGVLTDNRVWVDQDGTELVAAYRSDSIRLKELRSRGMDVLILSSELNRVVEARAQKMGV
jgi:N-acylneuraminate cytidylyltransferase